MNFNIEYDGNPSSALILEEDQLVNQIDLSSTPLGSTSLNFSYSPIENGERKLEVLLSPYHVLQVILFIFSFIFLCLNHKLISNSKAQSYMNEATRMAVSSPRVTHYSDTVNLVCPSYAATLQSTFCELSLPSGDDIQLRVNYGDGTNDIVDVANFNVETYGVTVPQKLISKSVRNLTSGDYILPNLETSTDGYLKSIQIYGNLGGTVTVEVI